jgi:hypothetical protein
MSQELSDLRASLFAAKDGSSACDAINTLTKLAKKGSEEAKKVLAAYVLRAMQSRLQKLGANTVKRGEEMGTVTKADFLNVIKCCWAFKAGVLGKATC